MPSMQEGERDILSDAILESRPCFNWSWHSNCQPGGRFGHLFSSNNVAEGCPRSRWGLDLISFVVDND